MNVIEKPITDMNIRARASGFRNASRNGNFFFVGKKATHRFRKTEYRAFLTVWTLPFSSNAISFPRNDSSDKNVTKQKASVGIIKLIAIVVTFTPFIIVVIEYERSLA